MEERILFVDDEDSILQAFRRILHKRFNMAFANNGLQALTTLANDGPFAVIVADMKMPEMDGIELLTRVRDLYPETVRLMLTGLRDIDVAVDAVNQGSIFRFLNKPTSPEVLMNALNAAITQYRLVTAERELLEKTLRGSVEVLTEIIGIVSPGIGGRVGRIRNYVMHVAHSMRLDDSWQFELAAMLSQIGCIAIPQRILEKTVNQEVLNDDEQQIFDSHPQIGRKLLAKIPRLASVAAMIGAQNRPFNEYPGEATNAVVIGAQILKACTDFDSLAGTGITNEIVLEKMRAETGQYNPKVLDELSSVEVLRPEKIVDHLSLDDLRPFMIIHRDVKAKNGITVIPEGKEINQTVLEILRSFAGGIGLIEPIEVLKVK